MKVRFLGMLLLMLWATFLQAQQSKVYQVNSPDGELVINIQTGQNVQWSVTQKGMPVVAPSTISLTLQGGNVLGKNVTVSSSKSVTVSNTIATPIYKKKEVADHYNQLTLNCKGGYGLIFRAYNDGVAYRFFTTRKEALTIVSEEATFNFDKDYATYVPYANDYRVPGDPFVTSFEAFYREVNISGISTDSLVFLPFLVDLGNERKAVVLEADLEDYPGMYVQPKNGSFGFKGVFAPYPLEEKAGGHNNMNAVVGNRADFIAKVKGTRQFPWRAVVISEKDIELANNDMVYKLASPSRIADISWIKPGKVAWDWWNNWNISGVDFRAGINTETYKYYIDFAAANKIEYIVMDEGWSESTDMMKISPRINLQQIIDYGKSKGVDVILWATLYAMNKDVDGILQKYAAMGAKGFKIDFLDRDDQKMVEYVYDIARKAAEHKMLVDYHGMFKPAGIQRTYPNVINFEGVKGLENAKWAVKDDVPRYDVTIPFIRMVAGPMDYTPGAMRNATKDTYRSVNSNPMSQGTRVHQLAMYVIFEAPLQMMADNPTAYMKEEESTNFIAKVPTTFDETVAIDGKLGEYIAMARRKGDTWFAGAMTNWTPREMEISLSFLGEGNFEVEMFKDGINADREATDYKREVKRVTAADTVKINMAPGGGWAARFTKVN